MVRRNAYVTANADVGMIIRSLLINVDNAVYCDDTRLVLLQALLIPFARYETELFLRAIRQVQPDTTPG